MGTRRPRGLAAPDVHTGRASRARPSATSAARYRPIAQGFISRELAAASRVVVGRSGELICTYAVRSAPGVADFAPHLARSGDGGDLAAAGAVVAGPGRAGVDLVRPQPVGGGRALRLRNVDARGASRRVVVGRQPPGDEAERPDRRPLGRRRPDVDPPDRHPDADPRRRRSPGPVDRPRRRPLGRLLRAVQHVRPRPRRRPEPDRPGDERRPRPDLAPHVDAPLRRSRIRRGRGLGGPAGRRPAPRDVLGDEPRHRAPTTRSRTQCRTTAAGHGREPPRPASPARPPASRRCPTAES